MKKTYLNKKLLTISKIEEIENKDNLQTEINFYESLKSSLGEELSDEIKQQISNDIPDYKIVNSYILFPIKSYINEFKFAAASSTYELKKESEATSFIDEAKNFLVRINREDNLTKLFVFPLRKNEIKNIKVVLKPSSLEYLLPSTELPLELKKNINIDSIEIVAP